MENYFRNCTTMDEVKIRFRQLSKALHSDLGGKASEFTAMKEQYDNLQKTGLTSPVLSYTEQFVKQWEQAETQRRSAQAVHLDPQELENARVTMHFNRLRDSDGTFDIIDTILEAAQEEGLKNLWVIQEVSKLLELNLEHFKYVTFRLKLPVSTAKQLYNKYIGV